MKDSNPAIAASGSYYCHPRMFILFINAFYQYITALPVIGDSADNRWDICLRERWIRVTGTDVWNLEFQSSPYCHMGNEIVNRSQPCPYFFIVHAYYLISCSTPESNIIMNHQFEWNTLVASFCISLFNGKH